MICDVSKWQGEIDWAALAEHVDYVAIKASGKEEDPFYLRNVAGAASQGVAFHAYHYLYCKTEAQAKQEAALFFGTVLKGGHWPLFWVLDCEGGWCIENSRARPMAEVFEAELRRLAQAYGQGEIRVALYIGQNRYYEYALDYAHYAYIWIPGYGDKWKPKIPCDVWQYTDKGSLPGIRGDVDLNVLIGDKPLEFFTGKEREDMSTVYVYGASIGENGNAHGGKAGNQTGRELRKQKWYKHSKRWRVFRAKSPEVAAQIAQDVKWAVANMAIGYDQYQRLTLYEAAQPFGFNCKLVKTPCETDCSALVRVCCAYAGVMLPNFRTTTEPNVLLNSGAFEEMVGAKYTDSPDYLKAGDILCTRTQGHTVIVGNDGSKAEDAPASAKLGDRDLRRGCKGDDVQELQRDLLKLGYFLQKYGADADFGAETEKAVRAFQLDHGLLADGVMQENDFKALNAALNGSAPAPVVQQVEITGNSVNVRSAPGTSFRVLGVVHKGDRLPYGGETRNVDGRDWYLCEFAGQNGWVSSKYSRVVM